MTRPAIATVFGILHIILGILLVMLGISGLVMAQFAGGGMGGGPDPKELQAEVAKSFPAYPTFDLANTAISIILPLLLIVAGVMLLKMNPAGRLLSIVYALAALAWGVVIIFIYATYVMPARKPLMAKVMNEQMEKAAAKQPGGKMDPQQKEMAENMGQMMGNVANYAEVCCGGVLMIYPLVVLLCMLFSSSLKNMGRTSRMDVLPGPENQPDDGWGRQ